MYGQIGHTKWSTFTLQRYHISVIAFKMISIWTICSTSTACSSSWQRNHRSSTLPAFCERNLLKNQKGPVMWKVFSCYDVILMAGLALLLLWWFLPCMKNQHRFVQCPEIWKIMQEFSLSITIMKLQNYYEYESLILSYIQKWKIVDRYYYHLILVKTKSKLYKRACMERMSNRMSSGPRQEHDSHIHFCSWV